MLYKKVIIKNSLLRYKGDYTNVRIVYLLSGARLTASMYAKRVFKKVLSVI